MAKSATPASMTDDTVMADGEVLNLRNRHLAAFLAWLIPGAGHYYQRRYLKSAIFFVSIVSSFLVGMIVSGNRCVYASWNETEKRWQFALQAGVGLPAIPAALQAWRTRGGGDPLWGGFMLAPKSSRDLDSWHASTASGFDMGTLYTMVAGLLNVLVIFDAYSGPLPPPIPKRKGREPDSETPDVPEASEESKSSEKGKTS